MENAEFASNRNLQSHINLDQLRYAAGQLSENEPLMSLFAGEAEGKAQAQRSRLKRVWKDLTILIALVRDWGFGGYRDIAWHNLIVAIAAVVYFLNPFDFTPDFVFILGYVDDAIVISAFASAIRSDLDHYRRWRLTQKKK